MIVAILIGALVLLLAAGVLAFALAQAAAIGDRQIEESQP